MKQRHNWNHTETYCSIHQTGLFQRNEIKTKPAWNRVVTPTFSYLQNKSLTCSISSSYFQLFLWICCIMQNVSSTWLGLTQMYLTTRQRSVSMEEKLLNDINDLRFFFLLNDDLDPQKIIEKLESFIQRKIFDPQQIWESLTQRNLQIRTNKWTWWSFVLLHTYKTVWKGYNSCKHRLGFKNNTKKNTMTRDKTA